MILGEFPDDPDGAYVNGGWPEDRRSIRFAAVSGYASGHQGKGSQQP